MAYRITKSKFQLGLQCERLLWLQCGKPDLADPITEMQQHIFDSGTRVGELARERFGGGVLVTEDYTQSAQALETTARLMADSPAAIFEGAYVHGGVYVRPDALVRVGDGEWDLYEVKSSTKLKDEHITDVAIQRWVLEGAGVKIRRTYLMHLDNTYVYQGGEYDLQRLFAPEDVTEAALAWQAEIPGLVLHMLEVVAGDEPQRRIGAHCDKPYTCAFYARCHSELPERLVTGLPRISAAMVESLLDAGLFAIDDVPPDFPGLTAAQREVCDLLRSGETRIADGAARQLAALERPLHFLDFETFAPALPLYPGTRPYQTIPFQWSDHVLHVDGTLAHHDFIFDGTGDPRPAFLAAVLEALGERGRVVVYSGYENRILGELARDFPDSAAAVERVQRRLFDLEKVIKQHVKHPKMLGRSSIKVVLPALVDALSYDHLGIKEGGTASLRYQRCAQGDLTAAEREQLFADLRAYCATDTQAMLEIFRVLAGKAA
jgi:predicted RecB family nuclease